MKHVILFLGLLISTYINAMEDVPLLPMQQELSLPSVVNSIEETKKSIATLPCIGWKCRNIPRTLEQQLTCLTDVRTSLEKQIVDNNQSKEIDEQLISIKNSILGIWATNKIKEQYFSFGNTLSAAITAGITTIDISHNNIEYLPLNTILLYASNVETINASYNKIAAISYRQDQKPYAPIWNKRLRMLNVSNNDLASFDFDTQFESSPNIEGINLSHNPLITCTWKNTDAWNCYKGAYYSENFPVINVRNTKLSEEIINNLKDNCLKKNIHCHAANSANVGSLIGIAPGVATGLGMGLNSQIGVAMGLEGANFILYPLVIAVLMVAEVGASAGLGYLVGRYCGLDNDKIAEQVEQNVISDYTNDAQV